MIDPRLLSRLNEKKNRLDTLRPFPAAILGKLREQLDLEWIYNSNAIEGSTLTLQETRLILEAGITIGGKSLREHFEVINHREAIEYVVALVNQDEQITPHHVRQIHQLVLAKIDDDNAGQYRRTPVRIAGAAHVPPDSWEVPRLMAEWGDWLSASPENDHPVVTAALAHHHLAAIHPFVDGNGRTARLVMNLVLMKDGYPPTVIEKIVRRSYYRTLARADEGEPQPLVNFVGRAVERSLMLYLEAITPQTSPPAKDETWILLREAVIDTPYSQEYLSLLARKGRLEARKQGRNWYTTRKAVRAYIRSVQG